MKINHVIALSVFLGLILSAFNCTDKDASADGHQAAIVDSKWKLVELEGQSLKSEAHENGPVHFILRSSTMLVEGFDGCSKISGDYSFAKGVDIHFSRLQSTDENCQGVEVKNHSLLDALYFTHSYDLQGDVLSFSYCGQAPIAVFEKL